MHKRRHPKAAVEQPNNGPKKRSDREWAAEASFVGNETWEAQPVRLGSDMDRDAVSMRTDEKERVGGLEKDQERKEIVNLDLVGVLVHVNIDTEEFIKMSSKYRHPGVFIFVIKKTQ